MKIQMKLKYTLVFAIISFFITTAGFAQQYSDKEIGLNVERATLSLKEHGVKDEDITFKISEMRKTYTAQYIKSEKRKNEFLQQISLEKKQKESTNRKATATAGDLAQDKAALIALYNSTNGANWTNTINGQGAWPINDPSAVVTTWDPDTNTGWYGVKVNSEGRVEYLNLENNNLSGTIPTEIGSISLLEWLDLDFNKLTGNIPPEIGQLTYLFALTISSNELTGSIPSQIGQLTNVRWLQFGENKLTGTIPPEIAQCQRLYQFIVHYNQLSGSIIPEFGLMPNLENLYLSHNQFTGTIPVELRLMTNIGYLSLSYNKLTGTIPVEITQCSNLYSFDLENNQLTGTIPTEIGLLTNLLGLRLDSNQFSGEIPSELVQCQKLSQFTIANNQFSGSIPSFLGSLPRLSYVWLTSNKFTGPIPKELAQCKELRFLRLDWNQLTGSLPSEFSTLRKLEVLNITDINLEGPIPDLTGTPLTDFYISYNKLRFTDFPIEQFLHYSTNIPSFHYYQQEKIDSPKTITDSVGTSITLKMYEDDNFSPTETFQWYKGSQQTPIAGATSREYTIPRLKLSDAGTYICRSSHPQITQQTSGRNLILEREPIKLEVLPCIPIEGAIKTPTSTVIENTNTTFSFETTDTRILTYKWTFYNLNNTVNSTGTTSTIQKTFNAPGNYKVELRTTDENECENIFNTTINVICAAPIGEITVDQQAPTTNQTLTFSFTTTATNISWYSWTFYNPDNTISAYGSSMTARNYFTREGICRVKLEVTTVGGCKTIFEKNITVVKPPCVTVTGEIKTSVENITANQDFKFSLETTNVGYLWYKWTYYNADGTILSTEDGSNSTGYKYYPKPGNYRVNLVVTDSYQCTTSFDKIITIAPQVCPTVTGTIKTGTNNLLVNANTLLYFDSASYFSSYEWIFYDSNNNIIETIYGNYNIKSFSAPGNYRIHLNLIDQNRCETSIETTVTVTQPEACFSEETGTLFTGENDTIFAKTNNEFYFNTYTDQNLHYDWTIYNPDNTVYNTITGNDNTISELNFETPGVYKISLKITDESGCTATFSRNFTVIYNCYEYGKIKDVNNPFSDVLPSVVANTNVTLYYNSYVSDTSGKEFSWSFINSNGEIIKTTNGQNFDVSPTELGDYKVLLKMTDPVTGCVNDFNAILSCVDECRMTDYERDGKITLNGEYSTGQEAIYIDLNQPTDVGLNKIYYTDTGRVFDFEWSLLGPTSQVVSTGTDRLFSITLTSPGFYQVVLKVTDPENGCSTNITRAFTSQPQNNSCTQTNERASEVQELARSLAKRLLQRTANGETDTQINNSTAIEEFIALKPFITNSPKDKIYNYKTKRDIYNAINSLSFSFSPERESDFYISIRDGVYTNGVTPDYLSYLIDKAVYIDVSQYVSSNDYLVSCNTYDQNGRSAKTILDPKDCRYSSEIKNINFCPLPCVSAIGAVKMSTTDVYKNRNTNFSFETSATDLTYKWTFYDQQNSNPVVYTSSAVDKMYTVAGNYNITLEVKDSKGCITTFEKTVPVTVNPSCTAIPGTIITSTPGVFIGKSANFSFDTNATDLTYKWTLRKSVGGTTIFTTKTVDFTYLQPGNYEVNLEVTNSNGCQTTFQKVISPITGPALCDQVTQFGRSNIKVNSDNNLFNPAYITVNQTANITFTADSYDATRYDLEYKWSIYNENNQLVDFGTGLNFPITLTRGGIYKVVLDLKEYTSGCTNQLTRTIVCKIPNSCAQSNQQAPIVQRALVNLLKNLIARSMTGETDSQINNSSVSAEFNVLKPYITSGPKDKIYNVATTRSTANEFTGISFSFSPDRKSDVNISIPHNLVYEEGMSIEYNLLPSIESNIYINLNQFVSSNQYLVSCYSESSSALECTLGSEIRYIDFCSNECNPLLGVIKTNTEVVSLNTPASFSVESSATGLNYNWTFYNADNTIKENQSSAIANQTYTVPGTYKVTAIVTDANSCSTTFTKFINVSGPSCVAAVGTIKTSSPNIFVGSNTNFYFDTTATGLTYEWTLYRDVNSSSAIFNTNTANIYYQAPGNYNVKLVVTDSNGCKNTFRTTATAVTKPACVAIVGEIKTANPIVSTTENATFSFETTATNLRYNWTFHSLNNTPLLTTTASNPTLLYPYPYDYKVSLTVTDENDCWTNFEKIISVVRGCPVLSGSANIPETVSSGQVVPFEYNTASTGISYNWAFYNLDGSIKSTSTASKINKAYYAPGNYRVTLELTDLFNYGCKTNIDKIVTVTGECGLQGTIASNPGSEGITLEQYVYFWFESEAIDLKYKWTVTTPDNVSSQYSSDKYAPYYFQSGSGTYKIALEVSDGNGCSINLEKTYNLQYDCKNVNDVPGFIYNNNHQYNDSPYALINAANKFTFYNYYSQHENLTRNWELTNIDGTLISSSTEKEFIFTPTTSDNLILKLTVTDQFSCPHHFSKELIIVDQCKFTENAVSGEINFDEEYSYKVAFIDANQTKDLICRFFEEPTKNYAYQWNVYDLDGNLVSSGNQQRFPITLVNAGYYKVTLDLIDPDANCHIQFSKKIGCMIYNSCTETNPKSQIVKDLYLNLMRSLVIRCLLGETDEQINTTPVTPEFTALVPYITNGPKDKIYNFKAKRTGESGFAGFEFSFSPDRQSDVYYDTAWSLNYDSWNLENTMNEINHTLYLDLNQYISADQSLVSCYVNYGGKMAGKNVNHLETDDCQFQIAVQYIDFCPPEDCSPITGTLNSTSILGSKTAVKKIQLKQSTKK